MTRNDMTSGNTSSRSLRRCLTIVWLGIASSINHSPAAAEDTKEVRDKRLGNRVQLWKNYASRTANLVARYGLTRRTSLLHEPLVTTGTLVYIRPHRLWFVDDGVAGVITRIGPQGALIRTRVGSSDEQHLASTQNPATGWLASKLLAMFTPTGDRTMAHDARMHVPRGGYRFELLPERDSEIRKSIRSVVIELDPVAGAVLAIGIEEAQGDSVRIELSDHRQNVALEDLRQALGDTAIDEHLSAE